jgi:hypothetical protein
VLLSRHPGLLDDQKEKDRIETIQVKKMFNGQMGLEENNIYGTKME